LLVVVSMSTCASGDGVDPARAPTRRPACQGPARSWRSCLHVSHDTVYNSFGATHSSRSSIYDDAGQLVRIELDRDSDGDVHQVVVFTRDRAGKMLRAEVDEGFDGKVDQVHVYTRDARGRPIRYERALAGKPPFIVKTWSYDRAGHLKRSVDQGLADRQRTLICRYGSSGRALAYGVDWDEDGKIDHEMHKGCPPPGDDPMDVTQYP